MVAPILQVIQVLATEIYGDIMSKFNFSEGGTVLLAAIQIQRWIPINISWP